MSPYRGTNIFTFFLTLFERIFSGEILHPATDEIQLLVLGGVAVSGALVGTFLVLRRMTMLANSLSHTILLGIVIAFLLTGQEMGSLSIPVMLLASLLTGLATAFLTEFLHRNIRLQEDAANGLVFSTLFALGIVLVTLFTRNSHLGIEVVMGNADALQLRDLRLVGIVLAANLLLLFAFYKEFKLTTFDPGLARAMGVSSTFFSYLLMTQVSATAVGGFRAVGVLMVLAFIVGPPLTARLLTDSLKKMLLLASLIGVASALLGVALARHLLSVYDIALSTGGVTVCVIVLFFTAAALTPQRIKV
jgi:manganese/zinc/iron transport system permease protein